MVEREQLAPGNDAEKKEGDKSLMQKSLMEDDKLVEGKTEMERKKQAEPIDKAEEVKLKELPYYHGYLSRDDIRRILRHEGDFVLRVSEVLDGATPMTGRQLVLSVLAGHGPDPMAGSNCLKLRNLVISRIQGQFLIDPTIGFATVKELVSYLQQNNYASKQGIIHFKKGVPLQRWEFSHADVALSKVLGEGAFGEVREGVLTQKNKKCRVAVKLGKGQDEASKEKIKEMMKEARIQGALRHRNVVLLYGIIALEQPIGIILELVDGGSLEAYLRTGDALIELKEKILMCSGAANGLSYIHGHPIIHRDIAARNCLYNGKAKIVKISDFGLSKKIENADHVYKIRGGMKLPIKWLAPETIKDLTFSLKTDVYSYGVLVWEVFSNGKEPWDGLPNADTKRKVTSGEFLTLPDECPTKLREFVLSKVFQLDKEKRCSMGDVARFMEVLQTESKMAEYLVESKDTSSSMQTTKTEREGTTQGSSRECPDDSFYNTGGKDVARKRSSTRKCPSGHQLAPRKILSDQKPGAMKTPSKEAITKSTYSNEITKSSEPTTKDKNKDKKDRSGREHHKKKKPLSSKFNRY